MPVYMFQLHSLRYTLRQGTRHLALNWNSPGHPTHAASPYVKDDVRLGCISHVSVLSSFRRRHFDTVYWSQAAENVFIGKIDS